ncbi:MAG: hypothetical protein OXR82_12365 [Gammaproteobacteria bacterium]|nr:hypothetical protein [Gammaproteobacteria bacterium]MDE0259164.1 hypothetical protein [Gammaproteobacteria bacterium]
MPLDPEIKAMSDIVSALEDLEDVQVTRVLNWAQERYSVSRPRVGSSTSRRTTPTADKGAHATSASGYAEFHDLFEAASPNTVLNRILVAAYWLQVEKNQDTFGSGPVNRELKHVGYPSSNITRDLNKLMNRSPKLVMKVRKEGSAKQSRNRYKLTSPGIDAVVQMLKKS